VKQLQLSHLRSQKKNIWGRQQQQQSQLQSEVKEDSWDKDDYPTQQQSQLQSEVEEESWNKDDYPTQQQKSEVQEDDYLTQQQQSTQSRTGFF
jgi:hypothetical protein